MMRVWDKWVCMCDVNHDLRVMGWYNFNMRIEWDGSWNWNDGLVWIQHETWKGYY